MPRRFALLACLFFVVFGARAEWDPRGPVRDIDRHPDLEPAGAKPDAPVWEVALPPFPKEENLVEFYVGPTARFRVYVDAASFSVNGDEVRFAHVVRTSGGATNVSYDGMRCSQYQRAIYASGRPDKTWARARNSDWRLINDSGVSGYFGALAVDVLCTDNGRGGPAGTAEQLAKALRAVPNLHR